MAILTVWQGETRTCLPFTGNPVLSQVLEKYGLSPVHPCGGRGVCGKCAVTLAGCVSEPNDAERQAGCRLSCQAVLLADAEVRLRTGAPMEQIETAIQETMVPAAPMGEGFGAAVDIGTTTLALKLCDLQTGQVLATAACKNPQTAVASDVMGRIQAAMSGRQTLLQTQILGALESLLAQAEKEAGVRAEVLVVTGNTTMLYLLTGRDPEPLSHAPFRADCLYGTYAELLGRRAFLPACMNAFVGADITCAVLASGMTGQDETALLCDIGTNGEIALWKDGVLYVTSTAAGPAFEGAGISCGCGSVRGAIDRVWLQQGQLQVHTIGDAPAAGLWGSGLIDAIAAFLELEKIDETGAMEEDRLPLEKGIALLPADVRAVQLAKAAIAAGIQTVLERSETTLPSIAKLYIAGGFGSHLNTQSAAAIGLIPKTLTDRICILGNAALSGAVRLLLDREKIAVSGALAAEAHHVNLGGDPVFNQNFMEQILFPVE